MKALHRLSVALLFSGTLAVGSAWFAQTVVPVANAEDAVAVKSAPPAHKGLVVEIHGIRHERGKVMVMIYDDQDAWERYDTQQMAAYFEFDAVEQAVRLDFDTLTGGPYAVALWHDENGDGELDMRDGYPQEGYGTSGARDAYDEVPFRRAAVEPGVVKVEMFYPDW